MNQGLRLFSVRGIPIFVHASWLAVYALITWSLAVGYFPRALPELSSPAHWANGLVAALLLFVSVLLHELSHAFVARAYGLEVRGITLHIFGGVSHLADEPPSPRAEFAIAGVGPLSSFALAGLLYAVLTAGLTRSESARAILGYLVSVNVALGLFNLVPGFPLDGGRILRAVLWRWKGSLARASYIASRAGVIVALVLIGIGFLQIFNGAFVGGFWMVLIGLFLRSAADSSYAQMALRQALATLAVRDVMSRDVVSIGTEATIAQLVESFWSHHFTSLPVVQDGTLHGIASVHHVHRVPRERWSEARVREVMQPLVDDLVIRPSDSALVALEKANGNGLGRLAVVDDRRLVGYLSLKDITHVLALRGLAGGRADGGPAAVRAPVARRAA